MFELSLPSTALLVQVEHPFLLVTTNQDDGYTIPGMIMHPLITIRSYKPVKVEGESEQGSNIVSLEIPDRIHIIITTIDQPAWHVGCQPI